MNDSLHLILSYLRGIWRYRWFIHLIAWPICIGGWVFVYSLPDKYESSARVFVDTESVLRPLLKGLTVRTDFAEDVRLVTNTLLSRPNIEKIVAMNDLDLNIESPSQEEQLYKKLEKTITVKNARYKPNLYTITYVNENPVVAKNVVQSLLTLLMESSLGDSRKDADLAQKFLNKQIQIYEEKLRLAEDKLKEFKRKNIGLMPNDNKGYFERLQVATKDLEKAELELREEKNRRDELRRQQAGEEPSVGITSFSVLNNSKDSDAGLTTSYDARLKELQNKLDDLLLTYTSRHPDAVNVKNLIVRVEQQREKELEKLRSARAASVVEEEDINNNPVYQRVRIALGEADANVAALQVRVAAFKKRVSDFKESVNTVPQVEAELKRLNRDYEIHKQNYESLVSRRESALISEQAERSGDNIKFRLIEPPILPVDPVGPKRLLFSAAVLIGGIAAGVLFALFLSQLKPTIDNRKDVRAFLELPMLGAVSMVWSDRQIVKNRLEAISFGLVLLVLITAFGGYVAFYKYLPNIIS